MLEYLKKHRYPVVFWIIFLLHFSITYYGVIVYRYQVAPGDDTLAHLQMAEVFRHKPTFWPSSGYPPGFHYLILGLGSIFHATPSHVLALIWPLFIVLGGLAVYYFARKAFDVKTALVAYVLFALVCPQPLQTAYDGGWPNIIATGIFLPISLVFWTKLWQRFRLWDLAIFLLTGVLIIYTHHLSTVMWLAILLVSGTVMVVAKAIHGSSWRRFILPVVWLVGAIVMYLLFTRTEILGAAKTLMNFGLSNNDSPVWPIKTYLSSLSGIVFQLALIGLIIAAWKIIRVERMGAKSNYLIVLASWFMVYFIISRLPVAEPGRAARDLALPASVLAALTLVIILNKVRGDRVVWVSLIVASAFVMSVSFYLKTASQLKYNSMVRFSKADTEALSFINNSGGPYPYLVWPKNGFWSIEAKTEIDNGRVKLATPGGLNEVAAGKTCGLLGYYKPGIWQEFLQDRSILDYYLARPDLKVSYLVEDSTKIWYLLCKK